MLHMQITHLPYSSLMVSWHCPIPRFSSKSVVHQFVQINALIEGNMSVREPVLGQPILADHEQLRGNVFICTLESVVRPL